MSDELLLDLYPAGELPGWLTISIPGPVSVPTDGKRTPMVTQWTRDVEAAASIAAELAAANDVYVGLGLRRLRGSERQRGTAEDVVAIPGLWLELDVAGGTHGGSNSNYFPTKAAARTFVDGLPVKPSAVVDSGGGVQVYWLFREPWVFEDEAERLDAAAMVEGWQRLAKARAKALGFDVDSTFDLARVLRVAPSLNHKVDPPPPVEVIASDGPRYNPSDFSEWAVPAGKGAPAATASVTIRWDVEPPAAFTALLTNDPRTRATWDHHRPDLSDQTPTGYTMALANAAVTAGWTDQDIADLLVAARRHYGADRKYAGWYTRTIAKARSRSGGAQTSPRFGAEEDRPALQTTQKSAAYRVAIHHQHELRVAPDGPLIYTGMRWEGDQGRALALAARAGQYTLREAGELLSQATASDDKLRKLVDELIRAAKTFEQGAAIREILKLTAIYLAVNARDLDSDPLLFNTTTGTLDLRTGALRPHDPADFITQLSPAGFDQAGDCPLWRATLQRILSDRLVTYLQKLFGLCLSGDTSEQKLFFLFGHGANGKSVVLAVLLHLLGSYGRRAMSDLLLASLSDRHPAEVAALRGARGVVCQELDRGRHWRAALMKEVTGEPAVTARLLYQNPVTFPRTWKTIIAANHKPQTDDHSHAFWRRVALIPFVHVIPETEQDRHLIPKLQAEAPGILRWALRGFEAWRADGLGEPPEVTDAVAEYRSEADTLATFINEVCFTEAGLNAPALDLWTAYQTWTADRGVERLSAKEFRVELVNRGFSPKHTKTGSQYQGLSLRSDVRREVEQ